MPNFDFECQECNSVYEVLVSFDKTGKYKKVSCPSCGSKKKEHMISGCNYSFSNPIGTDRYTSESGGHDYRFKHNLPNVLAQRQAAEEAGGNANPYNQINDLEKNDSWGAVK